MLLKNIWREMANDGKIYDVMGQIGVKQIILQGPPGTSKTHGAKEMILDVIKKMKTITIPLQLTI